MIGIVLVAVVILCAVGYRKLRQLRSARELAVRTANGICEGRYVRAGGVDQWIQIRGEDRANPILLIAAGAGLPMEPFTATVQPWERHFTVVFWDRRDVGRTRARNGGAGRESWTFDQLAEDGIEIIEFLCGHLGQERVILVGHSQGSIVGTAIARRRPDLLQAYVGTAQITDMDRNERLTYDLAVERARQAGNRKAMKALRGVVPPYLTTKTWFVKQRWSFATDPEASAWQRKAPAAALFWPGYGLADVYRSMFGVLFLPPRLFTATMSCTPETLGTRFEVPVFILQGEDDVHTLPSLAEEYLSSVDAPRKEFVLLPGTGHLSFLTRPDVFLAELLARVGTAIR
jgi:pimeloyl-ACP methyl ester carboxylesterase